MKTTPLVIISLIFGALIVVNAADISVEEMINNAVIGVNEANVHQFAVALEFYYIDNNIYPAVEGGKELVKKLYNDGYIKNKPLDPTIFDYRPIKNGQDYLLKVKQ